MGYRLAGIRWNNQFRVKAGSEISSSQPRSQPLPFENEFQVTLKKSLKKRSSRGKQTFQPFLRKILENSATCAAPLWQIPIASRYWSTLKLPTVCEARMSSPTTGRSSRGGCGGADASAALRSKWKGYATLTRASATCGKPERGLLLEDLAFLGTLGYASEQVSVKKILLLLLSRFWALALTSSSFPEGSSMTAELGSIAHVTDAGGTQREGLVRQTIPRRGQMLKEQVKCGACQMRGRPSAH